MAGPAAVYLTEMGMIPGTAGRERRCVYLMQVGTISPRQVADVAKRDAVKYLTQMGIIRGRPPVPAAMRVKPRAL